MAEIVYMGRSDHQGPATVSSMGTQPGPQGGDGWSVVARVPTTKLQAGRHYAFWVTGKIGNRKVLGPGFPSSGLIQLCLGDSGGVRHDVHSMQILASEQLDEYEAIPFAFLVIMSAAGGIADPIWGASWTNLDDLQLLGRTWFGPDLRNYSVTFDVTDVTFVWADLDAIPSSDQLVTVGSTSVVIPPSNALVAGGINTPGDQDQEWVHFWNVRYNPGDSHVAFQCGRSTGASGAGFVAKNGTGGRLGYSGPGGGGAIFQHGAFWVEAQDDATYLPTLFATRLATGQILPNMQRWAVLSIRLDDLESVYHSGSASNPNLTDRLPEGLFIGTKRFAYEVPAQGRSHTPWIFATGIPNPGGARVAAGIWIDLDTGELPAITLGHELTRHANEAAACYASAARGIGPTAPSIQYRTRFLDRQFSTSHAVDDVWFLAVFPVKDPDNIPAQIPGVGADVAVVPGRESASLASLQDPPIAPNFETEERPVGGLERSAGKYSRTWGVFMAVRREFPMVWAPMSATDRDTIMTFLQSTRTFRVTPPRALEKIAIARISQPTWTQLSAQTFAVEVMVGELIFIDP